LRTPALKKLKYKMIISQINKINVLYLLYLYYNLKSFLKKEVKK